MRRIRAPWVAALALLAALPATADDVAVAVPDLRAAILRPQLKTLADRVARWEVLYRTLEGGLRDTPGLRLIPRLPLRHFAFTSTAVSPNPS